MSKALLLINLGTPDEPNVGAVRKYLRQFLNDPRVIDIPWFFQKLLVNLIIIPFRVRNSTRLYKKLWTNNGSPLLYYLEQLVLKIQLIAPADMKVYGAMRYGQPSVYKILEEIKRENFDEITVIPLYPHYASSSTGSVTDKTLELFSKWYIIPNFKLVDQFYDHPAFLDAFENQIRKYNLTDFDHIIFSYHGLPERQINKVHPLVECNKCSCSVSMVEHGKYCYRATCYQTTRELVKRLNLPKDSYTTSFQSRLSKNWLKPFSDKVIEDLAKKGKKNVLVVAPAFVSDCLETIIEIGEEYNDIFRKHGGEKLVMVESLNDNDDWAKALLEICKS